MRVYVGHPPHRGERFGNRAHVLWRIGGLLILPPFGMSITFLGGYEGKYRAIALQAFLSADLIWWPLARD
jgi:hypothetical protein